MTTPPDADPPVANPQSPTWEALECDSGLRRVLAYICAQRHRRLIAGGVVFMALFQVIGSLTSIPLALVTPLLPLFGRGELFNAIYGEPAIIGLWVLVTDLLLPLTITLFIFLRLRRIYRGY